MKVTVSNLSSSNEQFTIQHQKDREIQQKYEVLERDHAELSRVFDSKVTELSEQLVSFTERWQTSQAELAAEKNRHEETKERLNKVLETRVEQMSKAIITTHSNKDEAKDEKKNAPNTL